MEVHDRTTAHRTLRKVETDMLLDGSSPIPSRESQIVFEAEDLADGTLVEIPLRLIRKSSKVWSMKSRHEALGKLVVLQMKNVDMRTPLRQTPLNVEVRIRDPTRKTDTLTSCHNT
jgi:hypothetical protein